MRLSPNTNSNDGSSASNEPKPLGMTKIPRRRTRPPVTKPQFKQRMVLPMVVGKPVVPGTDRAATKPQAAS
jgi:hypothetical protein